MTDRILRKPEVSRAVGLNHVTIWRLEKAGKFPRRLCLGGKAVGWRESDLAKWMEELPEAAAAK